MKKVLILVNTLTSVSDFIYSNHIEFFCRCKSDYPEISFQLYSPHRMSIDAARNTAGEIALRGGFDYLLFIDDDVMIQPDTFKILYETKKDIAAGLVVIRGMPFNVMAFRWARTEFGVPTHLTFYNDLPLKEKCADGHEKYDLKCLECAKVELQEVIDCDAVGFSVCLIDVDVLRPLTPPFFMTSSTHTEDVYFCLKTKELDPNPSIVMNSRVQPGHLLNPEPIEFKTRKKFFDFYEATAQKQEVTHRDKKHVERVMASLGIEVIEEPKVESVIVEANFNAVVKA